MVGRVGLHPGLAGHHRVDPPERHRANLYPQVELLSPADGDYSLTEPVFTWKPQREAAMYEFKVGRDANFSPDTYNICFTNHTSLSPYARVNPLTLKDGVPNAPIGNQLTPGVPCTGACGPLTTSRPTPPTPRSMASTATCAPSSMTRRSSSRPPL